LVYSDHEYLLLQKGRLAGWNGNSIKKYIERIAGGEATKTDSN